MNNSLANDQENIFNIFVDSIEKNDRKIILKGVRKMKSDCIYKKLFANFYKSLRLNLAKRLNSEPKYFLLKQNFIKDSTTTNIINSLPKTIREIYDQKAKFLEDFKKLVENAKNDEKLNILLNKKLQDVLLDFLNHKVFISFLNNLKTKNTTEYVNIFEEKSRNLLTKFKSKKPYKKERKSSMKDDK